MCACWKIVFRLQVFFYDVSSPCRPSNVSKPQGKLCFHKCVPIGKICTIASVLLQNIFPSHREWEEFKFQSHQCHPSIQKLVQSCQDQMWQHLINNRQNDTKGKSDGNWKIDKDAQAETHWCRKRIWDTEWKLAHLQIHQSNSYSVTQHCCQAQ